MNRVFKFPTHSPECEKGWPKGLGEFVSFQRAQAVDGRDWSGRQGKGGGEREGALNHSSPPLLLPTRNPHDNKKYAILALNHSVKERKQYQRHLTVYMGHEAPKH